MSQSTVSKARELLAKITPGKWTAEGVNVVTGDGWQGVGSFKMRVDAVFIAAAPELVSLLCDRVEKLEKALLGVHTGMGCWCKTPFVNISEGRPHEPRCVAARSALSDQE